MSVCELSRSNLPYKPAWVCSIKHILCVKPEPVLLSVTRDWLWLTEQYFPSHSNCDFRWKRGVVLFQCLWFDIITWPLWQQIWSAAKHLKDISQDSIQLVNYFKYRPDILALLQGQAYMDICTSTCTQAYTHFPMRCDKLLIALEDGHLVPLSSHSYIKIWMCQHSVPMQLLILCFIHCSFFMRKLNRFDYTWKKASLSTVCHIQYPYRNSSTFW